VKVSFNKLSYLFSYLLVLYGLSSCTPPVPSLGVSPSSAVLTPNESVTLTAALLNTSLVSAIAWTSTGGTLSATTGTSVVFRSQQEGTYQVTATAVSDPTLTRRVTITVGQAVSVGTTEAPSVNNGTLAGASSKTYILQSSSGLTKDALYFELVSSASFRITLFSQSGEAIATSDNSTYFSASDSSLALSSQGITTSSICRGPCLIVPKSNNGFVLTIENRSALNASYDLYIYNEDFTDTLEDSEPCNPTFSDLSLSPAIEIIPPEPVVRAIETVGDKDCFYSEAKAGEVTLATYSSTAIKVEVDVYQVRSSINTRFVGSLSAGPGQDDNILTFDPNYPVLIIARSGNGRAGPSGSSRYEVNYY
jgi:hypothetical protein